MINVTKTYLPSVEKYKGYIDNIFTSNQLTNNGQFVQELEKRLSDFLGVKNILLVANGTLALQVAYKLLNLSGDVITTPFSFVATTSSLIWSGLNPIFADIDKDTLCINPEEIKSNMTAKATAIVPVHVFGNGCEIEQIGETASQYNLKVIYDASHCFNVKYKDRSIFSYGDISTVSFHATKLFHTIEGGALIIQDDELYEKAKKMINFGIKDAESIVTLGINAKMNEFQAAMGLAILDDMEFIIKSRKRIVDLYQDNLRETVILLKKTPKISSNYSHFPVIFENEQVLLEVKGALNRNGINPRRYFYPSLDTLPYLTTPQFMTNSRTIAKNVLCLPIYPDLESSIQRKIISTIRSVVNKKTTYL